MNGPTISVGRHALPIVVKGPRLVVAKPDLPLNAESQTIQENRTMFTIANHGIPRSEHSEARLARLTDIAYQVALRHGFQGSFIELQLDLWNALRQELASSAKPKREPQLNPSSLYFQPVAGLSARRLT